MQRELTKTGCKYKWLWGTKNLRVFQSHDLANEPNYQHIPPSSVDCWMIYFYHYHSAHRSGWCSLVEGWMQWWHPQCCCFVVVIGHQPSTPADRFAAATAFAVLNACDTMLLTPAAALVDSAAAIRDATRLVSATAAVRHGWPQFFACERCELEMAVTFTSQREMLLLHRNP